MFQGVAHIGVGVTDIDEGLSFYGSMLGFRKVFDYSGPIPGLDGITGRGETRARVVMLRSEHVAPLGQGDIKLVQTLDPSGTPPLPDKLAWGELGICEVCVHASGHDEVFSRLVSKGAEPLLEPLAAPLPPFDTTASFSYVADPVGGKVELIEWSDMWHGLSTEPRVEGVNHVAFGVSDMERSRAFYAQLGFSDLIFDYDGYFEPMAPWYGESPPSQHIVMCTSWLGGAIEPVQHTPASPDCRGEWGHAGPMEFAVGVTNLDAAYRLLTDAGVEFHSAPEALTTDLGELRYAYVKDPDGLYVSLVETRY